jgi:hypothetical protein
MSVSQTDIERVVQEVLRRLAAMGCLPAKESASGTTLSLDTRLVTMAEVNGNVQGIERVEVPYRAVVTPAARDYLRERGVKLVHASHSG